MSAELIPSGDYEEEESVSCLFPDLWWLAGDLQHSVTQRSINPSLPDGHMAFSLYVCFFSLSSSSVKTPKVPDSTWALIILDQDPDQWPHINLITSIEPYLPTESHSELLQVSTSRCLPFIQPITNVSFFCIFLWCLQHLSSLLLLFSASVTISMFLTNSHKWFSFSQQACEGLKQFSG